MSWMDRIGGLLQHYSSGGAAAQPAPDVNAHFDQVAQAAPQSTVAEGLAAAFRSDRTPPFAELVSSLFAQSNNEQKASLLNRLMGSVNPGMLPGILSGLGLSKLGLEPNKPVSADQAQQLPPQAVQQLADHAQKNDPSIVDSVSTFYAQHPTLVKTLGSAALGVLLTKIAEHR